MTGYGRSDPRPIVRLKGLTRGRKEISIFHHHVVPLVRDEIANNGIDILPKNFTIREHVLDRVSDVTQAFSPFVVFASEITDLRSCNRIAISQLGKDQVLLGMVIYFQIDLEIADNRANNLVVGAVSPVENLKFPLEDGKQLLNIAMLLG